MNTLALILLAVGVLIAIVGVVVTAAGRVSSSGPPAARSGDWAAYDDEPGWADQGPVGQRSGSTARGGLATLALGVVVALVGGALLLFPVGDGAVDTAAVDAPAQEWTQPSSATSPTTSPGAAPGENDPESGPGTECGLVEPLDGGPALVRIQQGSIGCSEAVRVVQKYYDLPVDPSGGNTAPQQFDGWRCSTATAGLSAQRGYGTSCLKGDVQLVVPLSDGAGAGGGESAPTDSGSRPEGDLGLPTPMTRPSCDGRGIVVLYSAVTPGAYESEIRSALAANPGARYLRTDRACPSLRQRDENGNIIYAVYRDSGYSRAELCADVASAPAGAYGRWLDTTSDPTVLVSC